MTKNELEGKWMDVLTIVGEVFFLELMLLNSQSFLEEVFSLLSTDGNVNGDLLVSLNGETSDGVLGLGFDWLLLG